MKKMYFREWGIAGTKYWSLIGILGAIVSIGGLAALFMEHEGHWVTGMTNDVVWGLPHVFAIFLIVSASGVLNIASIGSVFGRSVYKPLARFAGLMSITLLVGGLLVLVLDLGRPDRLIVALTQNNFKSIFAWNIYFYTGFIAIVIVYLWTMMERKVNHLSKPAGLVAFFWRLALTTATGSIFGFIVARQAFDAAILAPMFIIMSFSYGLAVYILVLMYAFNAEGRPLGDFILQRLRRLLGVFIGAVLYFNIVYHLTNLYVTENHEVEFFILLNGGALSFVFWFGHLLLGNLLPLGIIYHPVWGQSRVALAVAAGLVVLGGLSSIYVIVVGGQLFPLQIFPDFDVVGDGFVGHVMSYTPSVPEILLGLGGIGVTLLVSSVGIRILKFLPESLADDIADPHHAVT